LIVTLASTFVNRSGELRELLQIRTV